MPIILGNETIKSDQGFSLVETLVALFVFSLLGVMGIQVLRSFTSTQMAVSVVDEKLAELQISGNIIKQDMNAAVVRPSRTELGGNVPTYFVGGSRRNGFTANEQPILAFTRGGNPAHAIKLEYPAVQSVQYWLENGSLIRRTYARPDPTEDTPRYDQVLLSDVGELKLRFRVEGQWFDEVEHQLGTRQSFPELIELVVHIEGRGQLTRVFDVGAAT